MEDDETASETKQQWEECVDSLGKYQLPFGKRYICGATENWGCPYLHPLQALVNSDQESRYVHLCNLKEAEEGWKTFLTETQARWDWVFEQIKEQNLKYNFRVTPMPAKNVRERSLFLKDFPLDRIIQTTYHRINERNYGFIFPASEGFLSVRTLRKVFRNGRRQGIENVPSFLEIVNRGTYIPRSMEEATVSPFPNAKELESLENIFIEESSSSDEQKVILPIGGQGSYAQRVSMEISYSAIYDIVMAQVGAEKVKKVKFG